MKSRFFAYLGTQKIVISVQLTITVTMLPTTVVM